ncbi:MAG TPA: Ku protein [Gammaproteobacteria bacterium]|nr:Ku protein [Gammaproteobacteria bacterium]
MAARAIWKGNLRLAKETVPVKLYSAAQDRTVHFRLLHDADKVPVKQRLVDPETDEIVEFKDARRAYMTAERALVLLDADELAALEPEPSRDIELSRFLPAGTIDPRWYDRPYYLGPDGRGEDYLALVEALGARNREGLAHWVMRKKEYRGALRVVADGCLALISLRSAEETIPASELGAPEGGPLNDKEIAMAQQLLSILESEFDPKQFRDEYRHRLLELIEAKAKGKTVRRQRARVVRPSEDLVEALRASLEQQRERKRA